MHSLGHGWVAGSPGLWWMQHLTLHSPATGFDQLLTWEQNSSTTAHCQRWAVHCWGPASGPLCLVTSLVETSEAEVFPQRVHSPTTALCQIFRLCSVGAAALSKPQQDRSDFRQEEQLVIKNNNLEVFGLYFPWLPHAQNLNPADKSCTFGFNIPMLF